MQSTVPKPPTYLGHKTKDKAFVYIRGENGRRRQIYLPGRYGSSECQGGGATVEIVVAAFLEWAETYYRKPDGAPTRELPNFVLVARPLLRLYRDELAAAFGPLKLKRVREKMISQGWARPTINKQVRRLKAIFRWGVENEMVEPGVYHALQAVTGLRRGRTQAPEPTPIRPVTWEDVEATLPHVSPQGRNLQDAFVEPDIEVPAQNFRGGLGGEGSRGGRES